MTETTNDPSRSLLMEMESPQKPFSMPGTPLHQLSPEKINQQRLPQSPTINSFQSENERPRHRDSVSSDVQSKVAFLNSLNGNTSPSRQARGNSSQSNNAALQRAVLGYEEAQATLATITAEHDRMKTQMAASQKRERMIAERIESLMEELQAERHKRNLDKEVYVKEIKKARKETYKAEFGQVEAREELKEARNELKRVTNEVAHEKAEKEKSRQEAFERAYALAGVMEETEVLKGKLRSAEKERDIAILQLNASSVPKKENESIMTSRNHPNTKKVQDVAIQAEDPDLTPRPIQRPVQKSSKASRIRQNDQIPIFLAGIEDLTSSIEVFEKQLDGKEITLEDQMKMLKQELKWAKQQNAEDADMIHFLHMQCQFKACPCRLAESRGERFVQDFAHDKVIKEQHIAKKRKLEEDQKFNQLPPEPTPEIVAKAKEETSVIQDAIEVPLPEAPDMELDTHNSSPDAIAHLEDITQVIVEPGIGSKPFSFSTSTSSHTNVEATVPPLKHTQSAMDTMDVDLFNLSPPKRAPPRPSTSMGILTLQSPIRLVPDSPKTHRIPPRSQTPIEDKTRTQSQSTRLALKDTSSRQHRRAQSRPNIRSQSRGRSPLVTAMSNTDNTISPSASPASTTVFPITPVLKQSRSHHALSTQAQDQSSTIETTTTTVMIPLRGMDGNDNVDDEQSHAPAPFHPNLSAVNTSDPDASISIPGTPVSREAALAQIRARRDRARSVNLKNQSGSILTSKSTPASAKRGLILERGRDISQASAPGRFGL